MPMDGRDFSANMFFAAAAAAAAATLVLRRRRHPRRRSSRPQTRKGHVAALGGAVDPRRARKMPHQPDAGYALEVRFRPRASDVILATFPKTGNTLLSQLAHQLRCPGDNSYADVYDVVPFLEFLWPLGVDDPDDPALRFNTLQPRVFKHHRFLSACYRTGRYVCTFREPSRALLSLYNMCLDNGITQAHDLDAFVGEFGVLENDWGWGRNIFAYYAEQWRCRDCDNVLLVCFEDLVGGGFREEAERLAQFMGVANPELSDSILDDVERACSRAFMLEHASKFDESVTYARMKAVGRWESPFRPAARVTDGSHHGKHAVSAALRARLEKMWSETLGREFGVSNYAELRARLAARRKKSRNERD